MKTIVVVPGRAPAWVGQHARHVAQRLTVHGRVMVAFSHGPSRAAIMPGEMGRETVLGAGRSGHPVWTGRVASILGLRGARDATVIIWWPTAMLSLALVSALVARLRAERVLLDEELTTIPNGQLRRVGLWALRWLATDVVEGASDGDQPVRVALAVCHDDREFARNVIRAFSGLSESVAGSWSLRLHTSFDGAALMRAMNARNKHRVHLERGQPASADLAGASVVITPFESAWADLAEAAAQSGAAGVLVGHAVAGRIARSSAGLWLATADPSSILVAMEASTGAALDAPVSIESLRTASDELLAAAAALAAS